MIDCVCIDSNPVCLSTEVFAQSVPSGDGLTEVEMHGVWQGPDILSGNASKILQFLDRQAFRPPTGRRAVLRQPRYQSTTTFLVSNVRVKNIWGKAAICDFVRGIEEHLARCARTWGNYGDNVIWEEIFVWVKASEYLAMIRRRRYLPDLQISEDNIFIRPHAPVRGLDMRSLKLRTTDQTIHQREYSRIERCQWLIARHCWEVLLYKDAIWASS